ncbi:hypothetical protein BDN72DRAFT_941721, partial [Pluteus cervinus]
MVVPLGASGSGSGGSGSGSGGGGGGGGGSGGGAPAGVNAAGVAPRHTHRMPASGSRDAPSFDVEKPITLLRFLDRMESLFRDFNITDGQEKKDYLCRYVDAETEYEWRAIDSFANTDTYATFREDVIESYPSAKLAQVGTRTKLEIICRDHQGIGLLDLDQLASLRRKFKVVALQLLGPDAV